MENQVSLSQDASDSFLVELRESDSRFGTTNPQEFRGAIEKFIGQRWGSQSCKAFKSTNGAPSWVVDLSDVLDGICHYAVVTTGSDGRVVAGFVDEERVQQIVKTGEEPSSPEPDPTATITNSKALEEAQRMVEETRVEAEKAKAELNATKPKTTDPVLVRHKSEAGETDVENWVTVITTHGEAGEVVGDLLAKGVQPSVIEIWSRKSSPRVTIEW